MAPASRTSTTPAPPWQVEAARYALLRRLAYALRHEMAAHLQPISMMAEVMERRLGAAEPRLTDLQQLLVKMQTQSRAASRSCLDVVTWMAPAPDARVDLAEGVEECLALLGGSFGLRGFTLAEDLPVPPMQVARAGLRHVLPAALLALTDAAQPPAEVEVQARCTDTGATLTLSVGPATGMAEFAADPEYRLLGWAEVEALAAADGIEVARDGLSARVTLPLLQDAAPQAGGPGTRG